MYFIGVGKLLQRFAHRVQNLCVTENVELGVRGRVRGNRRKGCTQIRAVLLCRLQAVFISKLPWELAPALTVPSFGAGVVEIVYLEIARLEAAVPRNRVSGKESPSGKDIAVWA